MPGSFKNSPPSLQLKLKPSRWLRLYQILLLVGLLPACWFNGLPPWLKLACCALVLLQGWMFYRASRDPGALMSIHLRRDGGWDLIEKSGAQHAARLLPGSRLMAGCVSLRFEHQDGRKRSLLLLSDCLAQDDFQKLRQTLRTHADSLLATRG